MHAFYRLHENLLMVGNSKHYNYDFFNFNVLRLQINFCTNYEWKVLL